MFISEGDPQLIGAGEDEEVSPNKVRCASKRLLPGAVDSTELNAQKLRKSTRPPSPEEEDDRKSESPRVVVRFDVASSTQEEVLRRACAAITERTCGRCCIAGSYALH